MPIIKQSWISRADLQANPKVYYVFGDNELRVGLGGQAAAMRGEPNAIGIATKKRPSNEPGSFWTDAEFEANATTFFVDFLEVFVQLDWGQTIVWPTDGIGTGLSDLPNRAPRTHRLITDTVEEVRQYFDGLRTDLPTLDEGLSQSNVDADVAVGYAI